MKRDVYSIKQAPLNDRRWLVTLVCGHEFWVTAEQKPGRKTSQCKECKLTNNDKRLRQNKDAW